jgi:hypothetical protein
MIYILIAHFKRSRNFRNITAALMKFAKKFGHKIGRRENLLETNEKKT